MQRFARVLTLSLLAMTVGLVIPRSAAASSLIFDETTGLNGSNIISQTFPDDAAFSTHSFDGFMTTQAFDITTFTVLGHESGNGVNSAVVGEIWSGLPGPAAFC